MAQIGSVRPPHLKSAVVMLRAVGGEKVRRCDPAFVVIDAAGQLAQVFLTGEMPRAFALLELQRHCVTEAKHFPISRPEARLEAAVAFASKQTPQPARVAVDVTQPFALPAGLD